MPVREYRVGGRKGGGDLCALDFRRQNVALGEAGEGDAIT